MSGFTESVVEAALAWLESAGWVVRNGAEIAPGVVFSRSAGGESPPIAIKA